MKKCCLLILSLLLALLINELTVSYLISYPKYVKGVKSFKIHNKLGPYDRIRVFPEGCPNWSVEGGNKVIRRNNIGLYGPDVIVDQDSKFIVLLGNSFIEAGQYSGEEIAAGVLQKELSKLGAAYQVVNLGASGHDPYVLWHRLLFFEEEYNPHKVILVYESFERLKHYLARWDVPEFATEITIKEQKSGIVADVQRIIRSVSSYANLGTVLLKKTDTQRVTMKI